MHSFQFGQAIEEFNAVLAADPGCAMTYWGIALSSWINALPALNRQPS